MLGLATLGFALNFWAWALLSPLGTHFKLTLNLTDFRQALLVAVPVIVGSLGRIPVGGDEVQLRGYESDGIPHASSWRAKVIRMDGRRIDLLELSQLAGVESTVARGR